MHVGVGGNEVYVPTVCRFVNLTLLYFGSLVVDDEGTFSVKSMTMKHISGYNRCHRNSTLYYIILLFMCFFEKVELGLLEVLQ